MRLSWVLVVFAFHGGFAARTSYARELKELRGYAREARRLFQAIPGWNETSSEDTSFVVDRSNRRRGKPGASEPRGGKSSRKHRPNSSESNGLPFEIGPRLTSGEPDDCLRDRNHVTAIFQQCIYEQVEINVSPSDDSSVKFLKYCRRTPKLRQCIKNTIIGRLERCLDEGINETIANVEEVTKSIIRLICRNEADRISIFLKDGGLECWKGVATAGRVLVCLNANLANHVWNSLFDLASLKLVADKCLHLELAERCVQQEAESCRDQTSVLIVDVVFGIAREVASCGGGQPQTEGYVSTPGTASTSTPDAIPEPTLLTTVASPNVDNTTLTTTGSFKPDELIIVVGSCVLIIVTMCAVLKRVFPIRSQTPVK